MIVITGATGNTGKPAAEALLAQGDKIRVIGRDASKLQQFVQKGAEAAAGSVDDPAFLRKAFQGAQAAYLLIPPDMQTNDYRGYQEKIVAAYAAAIAEAKVPYVVTLSSVGADLTEKSGPILGLHNLETKLNAIKGLNVLHLRPAGFMENLFMSVQPLRTMGMLPGPLPADAMHAMIAARDIGAYAAERLHARDFSGSSVQELHGQRDISMKEVAAVVGDAIGKPKLGYMQVPFMMLEPALVQTGLPKSTVALMIEMWKSMNSGALQLHEPRNAKNTTPTSIENFISEVFAPAYSSMAAKA
ncbi:MAG TPA: NmrA family NAD(P)-binding protein [Candidatus Acidoferrales bacterium]|nr:NmrA family NAD(P)-binding protein [Candidatus Acidoferrales bacterium]